MKTTYTIFLLFLSFIGFSQSFENGSTYYSSDKGISSLHISNCCDPVEISVFKKITGAKVNSTIKVHKTAVPGLYQENAKTQIDHFYFPPGKPFAIHYLRQSGISKSGKPDVIETEIYLIHLDKKQIKSLGQEQLLAYVNEAEDKMAAENKNAVKNKIESQEIPKSVMTDKNMEVRMISAMKEYLKAHRIKKSIADKIVITQKDFTPMPAHNGVGMYGRSKSAVIFYTAGSDGYCEFATVDFVQKMIGSDYEADFTVLGQKISKTTKFNCSKL